MTSFESIWGTESEVCLDHNGGGGPGDGGSYRIYPRIAGSQGNAA